MSRQGAQEVETVEGEIVVDADWLQTVPLVLTANTVNVCVPGLTSTAAESDGEFVSVYFFTEPTQTLIRSCVPVTVERASTTTEVALMLTEFVGQQMCTPAADGALQPEGTVNVKFSCTRVLLMSDEVGSIVRARPKTRARVEIPVALPGVILLAQLLAVHPQFHLAQIAVAAFGLRGSFVIPEVAPETQRFHIAQRMTPHIHHGLVPASSAVQ